MAFSGMNAREKTVVVVLGVVIVIALIGIGILAARLLTGGKEGEQVGGITVVATEAAGATMPGATITTVATPLLREGVATTPQPISAQPVVVGRQQSPGPGLPVIVANLPLHAGRRYRLEITAADASSVAIQGSWSQGAMSAGGQVTSPQIELFEGATPYKIDVVSPVANPTVWSMSASAGLKDVLGSSAVLVITVYDVTGAQ